MFTSIITVLHIFICVVLVLIVLLQQGKGADMGATFGGSSNTLFGAAGADTFLTKVTTLLAALFMTTSVTLAIAAKSGAMDSGSGLFQNVAETPELPVVPVPPATTEGSTTTPLDVAAPVGAPAAAGDTVPSQLAPSQSAPGMIVDVTKSAPQAAEANKAPEVPATQDTSTAGK